MSDKRYTAQEMREIAQVLHYNHPSQLNCEAAAMLRQAADMVERCDDMIAQCLKICGRETCDHKGGKCVCCASDILNYILRGDAGRGDK